MLNRLKVSVEVGKDCIVDMPLYMQKDSDRSYCYELVRME